MAIRKEITKDNELYLWMNGKLIFKRWLDGGYSKVFDYMAYGSYTEKSITALDVEDTPEVIHVSASLQLYKTESGGRKTGLKTGYRPNHVFEYKEDGHPMGTFIGDINFDENLIVEPGQRIQVLVRFLSCMPIEKYLNIDRKWWIHEGGNCIGEAIMKKIKFPEG
jgi:hypothetical protein